MTDFEGNPKGAQMLKQALDYIDQGWFVLPLQPKEKSPYFVYAKNGYKSATNNKETVKQWWTEVPNLNIGIACDLSGLVVLDIDFRHGGTTQGLADTYKVATGNGFHYYYKTARYPVIPVRKGIDIKYKGYVVAPPSIHPNGHKYEFIGGKLIGIENRYNATKAPTKNSSISISIFEGLAI